MKPFVLFILCSLFFFLFSPSAQATQCKYASTQARVQPNDTIPWTPTLTVGCEKKFRVGGFHNGTGQFAHDVNIYVSGPGNFGAFFQNGQDVIVSEAGNYTVTVRTNGQSGPGCMEQARVSVVCPAPSSCTYTSTQARVQNNINTPWASHISVGCERVFTVGSFQNHTGQFANDTVLHVSGPGIHGHYHNGQEVKIPHAVGHGTYLLHVSTRNQSGPACQESASVSFHCPTPTATPIPQNTQCQYQSTQSRVQKHQNEPWVKHLHLACNETFTIGSFHNNSGQFAHDTTILVTDPFGFGAANLKNGQRIRAFFPGQYMITAATLSQSGPACADIAFVQVSCSAPPIPDFWRSILQHFMVI